MDAEPKDHEQPLDASLCLSFVSAIHSDLQVADLAQWTPEMKEVAAQALQRDGAKETLIHAYLRSRNLSSKPCRLDVLRLLGSYYPASFGHVDWRGDLPLHVAMGNYTTTEDCLQWILDQTPVHLLRHRNQDGDTPVLSYFSYENGHGEHTRIDKVRRLAARDPSIFQDRSHTTGANVLHLCFWWESAVDIFRMLLWEHGQSQLDLWKHLAQTRSKYGELPLHTAVKYGYVSLSDVQQLVKLYLESVHIEDDAGRLPLHLAVARGDCSADIVGYLACQSPQSLWCMDKNQHSPLANAIESRSGIDRIRAMLAASTRFRPRDLWDTPVVVMKRKGPLSVMHYAMYLIGTSMDKRSHLDQLRDLLESFPCGDHCPTHRPFGTPLHFAARLPLRGEEKVELLSLLVRHFPASLTHYDHRGQLAVQVAAHHVKKSLDAVYWLLRQRPDQFHM